MLVLGFYTATIGFVVGIMLGTLTAWHWPEVVWLLVLACAAAVVGRRARFAGAPTFPVLTSLFLLTVSLGLARFALSEDAYSAQRAALTFDEVTTITGTVVREPDQRERSQQLTVATASGTILVQTDRLDHIAYGDLVQVVGTLTPPRAFTTELGRTFDYPGFLAARGVIATLAFGDVVVLEHNHGNRVVAMLLRCKQALLQSIQTIIPEPQAGLGAGLLLGVKQALGDELETAFRMTGIIHIVVLSGFNVMIVAEAIMRLLALVCSVRTRVVVGIVAIAGFAVMVGLGATVVRASIMAALVLIARATNRHYELLRALLVAGLVMLFITPHLLMFDPGFQLSFLATLGLIFLGPWLEARLHLVPTTLQIREFLTATVVTQIFVLPLLLYQMGQLSIVAVVVNVLVLPVVPAAMLLVFLTGVIGWWSSVVAGVVGMGATVVLSYIIGVASKFAALPIAAVEVPEFSVWWMVAAYGGYLCAWYVYQQWRAVAHEGWNIEAEDEVAARSRSDRAATDTPVFFR